MSNQGFTENKNNRKPESFGSHLQESELYLETKKNLNVKILKITMTINESFPELIKYLEEMQDTIPKNSDPEITLGELRNYYNSLNSLLGKYILEHP